MAVARIPHGKPYHPGSKRNGPSEGDAEAAWLQSLSSAAGSFAANPERRKPGNCSGGVKERAPARCFTLRPFFCAAGSDQAPAQVRKLMSGTGHYKLIRI
jgi:hypothetical protein